MEADTFGAAARTSGEALVIDLAGEINADAETALLETYRRAAAEAAGRIVLNFAQVTYINSTGIALIVGFLAQARRDHREVVAIGLSDHYRQIFEITRLSDFMAIHTDEQSAVA
jgi:anti-sigma B factor antagonist